MHKHFYFFAPNTKCALVVAVALSEKKEVQFSMAIGNVLLMHECFPIHVPMGTARIKEIKETDEEHEQKRVDMNSSKVGTK